MKHSFFAGVLPSRPTVTFSRASWPSYGRPLLLGLATVLIGGCASINRQGVSPEEQTRKAAAAEPVNVSLHAVIARKDGLPVEARSVGKNVTFSEPLSEEENRTYLTAMIDSLKAHAPTRNGKKQILIFIHGGMNEKKGTVRRTQELSADESLSKQYYPICIDWNSAPMSTYVEHLFFVRRGSRHPVEGVLTSPILLASDVARGISRAPVVWSRLAVSASSQPGGFGYPPRRTLAAQEALKVSHETSQRGPIVSDTTIVEGDQRTPAQGLIPGIHTLFFIPKAATSTVIDIVGTGAWDMMLRRSEELFRSPTSGRDLRPEDEKKMKRIVQLVKDEKNYRTPQVQVEIKRLVAELSASQNGSRRRAVEYLSRSRPGAVEQFLRELETQLGPDARNRYSITLVGHSMGTIVSNEMLSSHPNLPFDEIIYMAAACSVNECVQSVGSYLQHNRQARFYNLSLHPICESGESNPSLPTTGAKPADWLSGGLGLFVPRGSLLMWLDDFFTKPVSLQQRRMGKWNTAVTEVNLFPQDVQNRVHLKMFAAGPSDAPQKHGAFASEGLGFWNPEFRQPQKAVP